jgi:single-strand DNA-binding protein
MNVLTIAGNIGKDAELRTTQNGKQVAGFSVAVLKGRDQETTWFNCSLWGERAAKLASYLTKGSRVTVSGEVSAREHNGKAYLQVFVRELTLQGGGERRDDASHSGGSAYGATTGGAHDDVEDSIPF